MQIALASDHAGYQLKTILTQYLANVKISYRDFGVEGGSVAVDYADYAHLLCQAICEGEVEKAVLICGSGIGMAISANRHTNIRAALCHNIELVELSRQHNDANILVLGARFVEADLACKMLDKFLQTCFEGGRHCARVAKIEL